MGQHDPGGTGYAQETSGPIDDVRVRWTQSVRTEFGVRPQPAPVVANGLVYAVGAEFLAASADSGEPVFRLDRAFDASPAVASARAYQTSTVAVPLGDQTIGLHGRGGFSLFGWTLATTRWTAGTESSDTSVFTFGRTVQPPPVAAAGVILTYIGQRLTAIEASSGAVRWQAANAVGRPAVRDGTAYVSGTRGRLLGYDIDTGEREWIASLDDLRIRSVTATPDRLVAGVIGRRHGLAGISYDGTVDWRFTPTDYYLEDSAIAVANDIAYTGFETPDGDHLLAVDTIDGSLVWEGPVSVEHSNGFASPAVTDEMVYVPTEGGALAGVDRTDGTVRWRFSGSDEAAAWSAVALADGTLYALEDGQLYALEEA